MRVVHVVSSLELGGQERLVVRMAKALATRDHDVHVVTLAAGGALRSELAGLPVHEVAKGPGLDRALYARLFALFRRLRPDVVHTHNALPLEYAAPAARLARVRRRVHTKHGHIPYSRAARLLARAASRCVHGFVAVSEDTADTARREERPLRARLSVIENGIPLGEFAPSVEARRAARDELGIAAEAKVIGFVGRLVHEKDVPLLVRAAAPLLGPDARLVIVGDGPTRDDVERARAGSPWVTLTGARSDVPRLLTAFDVFALSSSAEGLPLVLPEAMATGLPVVATAVGGVPSAVPAEVGTLVRAGDAHAFRAALARLLADDALRARSGAVAREHALAHFDEGRMIDRYLALYAE